MCNPYPKNCCLGMEQQYLEPVRQNEPLGQIRIKIPRADIGGKTGKTAVLPGFCKTERGRGSGGAPPRRVIEVLFAFVGLPYFMIQVQINQCSFSYIFIFVTSALKI